MCVGGAYIDISIMLYVFDVFYFSFFPDFVFFSYSITYVRAFARITSLPNPVPPLSAYPSTVVRDVEQSRPATAAGATHGIYFILL